MTVNFTTRKFTYKLITVFFLMTAMLLMSGLCVFASPDTLPGDVYSTTEGIVTVKTPELSSISTTNKKLPISVTASEGVLVTVYKYNYSTGAYHKVWVNDSTLEAYVGSTMLFAGQADLTLGSNLFLVRAAWDDSSYQVVKFEVNLLNEGFMDRIKNIALGIGDMFN